MSPLRLDSQLNPAAPLVCNAEVDEIIERLVECGCELNQPVMSAHDIENQLSSHRQKCIDVRRGGRRSYHITTRSTRLLDSNTFIAILSDLLECCSLAAGYLRRWAASHSKTVELIVTEQVEEIRQLNAHVQSAAQQLIEPDPREHGSHGASSRQKLDAVRAGGLIRALGGFLLSEIVAYCSFSGRIRCLFAVTLSISNCLKGIKT